MIIAAVLYNYNVRTTQQHGLMIIAKYYAITLYCVQYCQSIEHSILKYCARVLYQILHQVLYQELYYPKYCTNYCVTTQGLKAGSDDHLEPLRRAPPPPPRIDQSPTTDSPSHNQLGGKYSHSLRKYSLTKNWAQKF